DQIFTMNVDGTNKKLVSTGKGRTTCAYFFPDGKHIIYASTHDDDDACPPDPDKSKGYVWGVFNAYDIYIANPDGSNLKKLFASKGYDAEATISPDGKQIVFTSSRDGDLEIYTMDADGKNVKRLTREPGYDGGAFFSHDGKKIVYRAHHPVDPKEIEAEKKLLKEELVKPTQMELFIMNADGTGKKQLTHNGAANFAPFFTPDDKRIIFSSNLHNPKGFDFDLFLIDTTGENIEQVTTTPGFDGFPMFSPDGKKLAFVSARNASSRHEFNIFLADWIDDPVKENLIKHEQYLASDALEGRKPGLAGNLLAAEYIADQFKQIGLQPLGENGTFFQNFEVVTDLKLGKGNYLTSMMNKKKKTYTVQTDFMPIGFSADTSISGNLVFAGFGITAKDLNYDDYKNIDIKGKIAIVLRGTPDGDNPHSEFRKYASLRFKATQARQAGASGIIFVNSTSEDSSDALVKLRYDNSFAASGIVALSVSRNIVNEWLKSSKRTVDNLSQEILKNKKPLSFVLKNQTVSITSDIIQVKAKTQNVAAILKSNGTISNEQVIIGAHYDHLGYGGEGSGSLAPDKHEIHNGADDNASGTSSLIEIARQLSIKKDLLKRDIVFISFSGEEMGLLGSAYYTANPLLPLDETITMINLDMVGRLRDKKLDVQGTGTSTNWETLSSQYNPVKTVYDANGKGRKDTIFTLAFVKDGYGPSDHASFYGKDIPVLFYFTGVHEDYHKPTDDVDKINYDGMRDIVNYVSTIATVIDTTTQRPDFHKTATPKTTGGRGFNVTLGTIPDYSYGGEGMKLAGVREVGPAKEAGLQTDDIILKLGSVEIKNIYDYMYALEELKAGEETTIVIKRGNEQHTLKITPQKPKR
ncbi:MAG: M28 family peptidase, partial [Bacteroidetes bacterium]|nr:M28 family peptidase [Bacteroidota bacterium]